MHFTGVDLTVRCALLSPLPPSPHPVCEMTNENEVANTPSSSSEDEADDKPKPKRTMKGMLLQYMLYDAFIRPTRFVCASLTFGPNTGRFSRAKSLFCTF